MTPRDRQETLEKLKERYSNDLDPQEYERWLWSVEKLVALKTSLEKFRQSTIMPTEPQETIKNLDKEAELVNKVVIEINKLKDIIKSGIAEIDEKRVNIRLTDIISEADAIARNTQTNQRNVTPKREKNQSVPSSKKGLFGTRGQTSVKPNPAKAQSAPPKLEGTEAAAEEAVDQKKHVTFSFKKK